MGVLSQEGVKGFLGSVASQPEALAFRLSRADQNTRDLLANP